MESVRDPDTFETTNEGGTRYLSSDTSSSRIGCARSWANSPHTMWGMLPGRDDLATKSDLSEVENTLRGEIAALRTDVATLRTEMAHRYATKDDLFVLSDRFNEVMSGHVRTFIVVQVATVVGMSTILFGLLRFF